MNFYAIFKKECRSYFSSLIVYIVLAAFLLISGYFFYTDIIYFVMMGMSDVQLWMWQYLYNDIRFVLLFIIPLLTMRLFAEEKKSGTIELLFTYPLKDRDIVMGKFAACMVIFILMLALSLTYPIILHFIFPGQVNPAHFFAIYLGTFLLGCAFVSCGIFISSLTENQVVAAIVTLCLLIFLWFVAWNEGIGGETIVKILLRLSFLDHYNSFLAGVIETKNLTFFFSFIIFFLFLTMRSLESRRWKGRR